MSNKRRQKANTTIDSDADASGQNDEVTLMDNAQGSLTPAAAVQNVGLTNSMPMGNPYFPLYYPPNTGMPGVMGNPSNQDVIGDIMNEIASDEEKEEGECELDPEVELMLADLQKKDSFGEPVSAITARTFTSIHGFEVTKEVMDEWKRDPVMKTPKNCEGIVVPAVNNSIWGGLPMNAKTADVNLQALQQHFIRAQVAHMRLMDEMLALVPKEKIPRLLKPLLDSGKCITAAMNEINLKRRQQLKPFLKSEYLGISSSQVPVTAYLYGNDLEKSMKEAKATASIVKPYMSSQFKPRFHPYNKPYQAKNLNYSRPSAMGRGGQQYQKPRFGNQRFRPQYNQKQKPFQRR